jgi:transcriptional regulator with XRE-family HTH domain
LNKFSALMHISKNISYLRKLRKMKQSSLAKLVGKSTGAISTYERGTAEPTAGVIIKLAEALEVSVNDLLNKDLTKPQVVPPGREQELETYIRDMEEGYRTGEEVLKELGENDITLMNKLLKRRVRELEEAIRKENPGLADKLEID